MRPHHTQVPRYARDDTFFHIPLLIAVAEALAGALRGHHLTVGVHFHLSGHGIAVVGDFAFARGLLLRTLDGPADRLAVDLILAELAVLVFLILRDCRLRVFFGNAMREFLRRHL